MDFLKRNKDLIRDLGIFFISVLITILLVKTGVIKNLLSYIKDFDSLVSFVSGMFFVSIFTVTLSTATLIELSHSYPPVLVALFGGIGALFGDLIIFRFIRDKLSVNILEKLMGEEETWFVRIAKWKIFKIIGPFIGALIIISPFPDELGLALMGFSKLNTYIFIPLAFGLNFVGIWALIYFLK